MRTLPLRKLASRTGWLRTKLGLRDVELPFADHVHRLDARDERTSAAKFLEPQHGSHDAFDRPMVLLDDVVEVT